MKLEIELDLNQIDYNAINKQIQDKIASMDLHKEYQIESKINSKIKEEVGDEVDKYFRGGTWGGLNNSSQREINDEISNNLKILIAPHIENIFSQLPQEELNKLISDLIPKIMVDMISDKIKTVLVNFFNESSAHITNICDDRIRSMLGR